MHSEGQDPKVVHFGEAGQNTLGHSQGTAPSPYQTRENWTYSHLGVNHYYYYYL
jgi:hypothetical protein